MKKFLCTLWCICKDVGYARAAAVLAREGRHEDAKRLMLAQREECKC